MDVQNVSHQLEAFSRSIQEPRVRDANAKGSAGPKEGGGKSTQGPEAAKNDEKKAVDELQDEQVADKLNEFLKQYDRRLHYYVHEETNRLAVKIIDNETQEVIKEIPPEAVLELAAKIKQFSGLFLDTHV